MSSCEYHFSYPGPSMAMYIFSVKGADDPRHSLCYQFPFHEYCAEVKNSHKNHITILPDFNGNKDSWTLKTKL